MTDQEFEEYYTNLSDTEKLNYLDNILQSVLLKNGERYSMPCYGDLEMMIEQELYQELTGRD